MTHNLYGSWLIDRPICDKVTTRLAQHHIFSGSRASWYSRRLFTCTVLRAKASCGEHDTTLCQCWNRFFPIETTLKAIDLGINPTGSEAFSDRFFQFIGAQAAEPPMSGLNRESFQLALANTTSAVPGSTTLNESSQSSHIRAK